VRFGEGDPVDAELVGTDPSTDIAVIKVEPGEAELKPIELGDSSAVKVGDPTIAIGNPFGFDRTVTTGIVSALQREIEAPNGFSISDVIQTDASINPGNSGGPLLDGTGRVIGINSQIATGGSQGSVGIGFAVPINTAKDVIPQLKDEGEVKRAFLGITTAPVTQDLAEEHDLPADRGALVQEVVRDGPSDDAGIRAGDDEVEPNLVIGGDLITKVDGVDIQEPQDVAGAIADNKPGDKVTIEFYRGDERKSVEVELGERPDEVPGSGGGGGGGGDEDQPRPFPFP
jgi:S1-C subfamily serine protease